MSYHAGNRFSTPDRDHDGLAGYCPGRYKGGWWYNDCLRANLNGLYLNGPTERPFMGMIWVKWRGHFYSLKKTEMKLRPT